VRLGDGDGGADVEAFAQVRPEGLLQAGEGGGRKGGREGTRTYISEGGEKIRMSSSRPPFPPSGPACPPSVTVMPYLRDVTEGVHGHDLVVRPPGKEGEREGGREGGKEGDG